MYHESLHFGLGLSLGSWKVCINVFLACLCMKVHEGRGGLAVVSFLGCEHAVVLLEFRSMRVRAVSCLHR